MDIYTHIHISIYTFLDPDCGLQILFSKDSKVWERKQKIGLKYPFQIARKLS